MYVTIILTSPFWFVLLLILIATIIGGFVQIVVSFIEMLDNIGKGGW